VSGLVWLLLAEHYGEDSDRQWRLKVLAFFLFFSVAVIASESKQVVIAWLIVGCVTAASVFDWFDLLRPFRFVAQGLEGAGSGRGAGTFINPNIAASFIAMGTIAALPFMPMRLRAMLLVGANMGVVPTFSRAGLVFMVAITLGAMFMRMLSRAQIALICIAIPLLIAGSQTYYDHILSASEDTNLHTIVRRLTWLQGAQEEDAAVEGRRYAAQRAWEMFIEEPVAGHGIGATMRTVLVDGPHNMYVMLMAEQGFLGLILYLSLIWIVVRRGWVLMQTAGTDRVRDVGKATVIFGLHLAAYGVASHNVLEEPQGMFLLAFMIAAGFRAQNAWDARQAVGEPVRAAHLAAPAHN